MLHLLQIKSTVTKLISSQVTLHSQKLKDHHIEMHTKFADLHETYILFHVPISL